MPQFKSGWCLQCPKGVSLWDFYFYLFLYLLSRHTCAGIFCFIWKEGKCCAKRWTVAFSSLPAGKLQTKRKDTKEKTSVSFGAEGETRTLAPVARPTPLAGAPRHQLEYFCMVTYIIKFCCCRWRREWDSNPRYVAVRRFSRPFRYNRFGISP